MQAKTAKSFPQICRLTLNLPILSKWLLHYYSIHFPREPFDNSAILLTRRDLIKTIGFPFHGEKLRMQKVSYHQSCHLAGGVLVLCTSLVKPSISSFQEVILTVRIKL